MHSDGKIVLHTYVWLTNNGCKGPEKKLLQRVQLA